MRAISLCFWKRTKYALAVLESLSQQPSIKDYILIIGIDGEAPDEIRLIDRKIKFAQSILIQHSKRIGCNLNTKLTLGFAFHHFDYVVHVEEDVLLAPDALRYFEWAQQFGGDPTIFTATAWRHTNGWQPGHDGTGNDQASACQKQPFFTCWGWATWRNRWLEMCKNWSDAGDMEKSWDVTVSEIRGDRFEICPMISRAINIGSDDGLHRGDYLLPYWAGSVGFTNPKEFNLIDK